MFKKKDQIVNDLTKQLNIILSDRSYSDEQGDYNISTMEYENGDLIRVYCSDWSNKVEKNEGWSDNLRIEIITDKALSLMGF